MQFVLELLLWGAVFTHVLSHQLLLAWAPAQSGREGSPVVPQQELEGGGAGGKEEDRSQELRWRSLKLSICTVEVCYFISAKQYVF